MKKVLFGTPCYGGQLFDGYLISTVKTVCGMHRDGIDFSFYTLGNESLINRARNKIANYVLNHPEIDRLLFIDSDITWEYDQFLALFNSDKMVVGGTYPMKTSPIWLNFNTLPEHQRIFKGARKGLPEFQEYKKLAAPNGEIEVMHIPTGFMMIRREVFQNLAGKVLTYRHNEGGKSETHHEFFPVRVKDGVLESEDWAFCSLCREHGMKIYFNTNIITKHTGMTTWSC
jgi:hypothetical protein